MNWMTSRGALQFNAAKDYDGIFMNLIFFFFGPSFTNRYIVDGLYYPDFRSTSSMA